MKKAIKIAAITAAVVAAGAVTTAVVSAWGDNTGGRRTYTVDEINKGALGDKIVFNSIKDDTLPKDNIHDERNFVGARDATVANNGWNGNDIEVEEGKTYYVRLYVHNNNPKGTKAVAKDVTVNFSLPTVVSTEQRVDGYINASNATPSKYWDDVVFKSKDGRKFYLDYIEGSALLENNSVGKKPGLTLSDSVVTSGTKIGYDALNGEVPGCYQYANYITIKVKPVFESSEIQKTVRKLTDEKFSESVTAKIGETVEYQILYKNLNNSEVKDVTLRDSLPTNMEYIKGSTILYNSNNPKGLTYNTNDKLTTEGINIGGYKVGGNAYIRFRATVKDASLVCGNNRLINWAKAVNRVGTSTNVDYFAVQDSAIVLVDKECEKPEIVKCTIKDGKYYGKAGNVVDEATYKEECEKPDDPETTKCAVKDGKYYGKDGAIVDEATYKRECESPEDKKLPDTGASAIAAGAVGLGGTVSAAGYYIASRKQLR
ncbi:DUF11 domain-containing protein [Candidatus Saccharibacteria bacterium]|nr:DUF11 domain-containing protein [Candidatus Saccharibacteria bacterium]